MVNIAFKMLNCALKMMNFALQMTNLAKAFFRGSRTTPQRDPLVKLTVRFHVQVYASHLCWKWWFLHWNWRLFCYKMMTKWWQNDDFTMNRRRGRCGFLLFSDCLPTDFRLILVDFDAGASTRTLHQEPGDEGSGWYVGAGTGRGDASRGPLQVPAPDNINVESCNVEFILQNVYHRII